MNYHDDYVSVSVVSEPGMVYAWETTDLRTGRSWLSIYRSVLVRDDDRVYQRASEGPAGVPTSPRRSTTTLRDLIGDRELVDLGFQTDPMMMFGRAETALYAV